MPQKTKTKNTNSRTTKSITSRIENNKTKTNNNINHHASYSYYSFTNMNGHTQEKSLNLETLDGKHVSGKYFEKENNKKKIEKTFNNKDISKLNRLTSK